MATSEPKGNEGNGTRPPRGKRPRQPRSYAAIALHGRRAAGNRIPIRRTIRTLTAICRLPIRGSNDGWVMAYDFRPYVALPASRATRSGSRLPLQGERDPARTARVRVASFASTANTATRRLSYGRPHVTRVKRQEGRASGEALEQ